MKVKEKKQLKIYCAECLNYKDECKCAIEKGEEKNVFIPKKKEKEVEEEICVLCGHKSVRFCYGHNKADKWGCYRFCLECEPMPKMQRKVIII